LREAILAELQPSLADCTLKRSAARTDGGYLMCENLIEPIDAAYSVRLLQQRRLGLRPCRAGITFQFMSMTVLIRRGRPAMAVR